uniref:HNH/ENDO VII family nuclease n=1 Tax=Oceanospirillum beijerinckii TaxID=64976 RepID=UPI0024806067
YYDPEIAQYLTPDPIGMAGGLRPQGYVHNPVEWIDPLGLAVCAARYGRYKELRQQGHSAKEAARRSKRKKFWSDGKEIGGRKVFQRDDLFDPSRKDDNGLSNIERMKSGKAPIGRDDRPVNLHHLIQREPGAIAEVGGKMHSEETKRLHIPQYEKINGVQKRRKNYSFRAHDGRKASWPRTKSGRIKQTKASREFSAWSSNYWKRRAEDFK